MDRSPEAETFHEGERLLQELLGVGERMAEVGPQVIRDYMPDQHRQFFTQLPFVLAGSMDATGQAWASVLANPPGFISSPDSCRLQINAQPMLTDPLIENLKVGADIALLGIEQHTRRRNRMNGIVTDMVDGGFAIRVKQSFGNCPKYIQARRVEYVAQAASAPAPLSVSTALNEMTRKVISQADTFFIATSHPASNLQASASHGVDVSHRGGRPGFVRVDHDDMLTVPDFSGNRFFNTLGNIMLNPKVGLLFIDFEHGDIVNVAADAEIIFNGADLQACAGAERLLRFRIRYVRHVSSALPLRWSKETQISPYLENTGCWAT